MRKILVIGSWAKEQITIENIRKKNGRLIYAYMDTFNPGIIDLVDDYRIGDLYDVKNIVDYAAEIIADLVIITTASPLAAGAVDLLDENKIPVFGPTKSAARLESDKAFTRELLKKYAPEAVPGFIVCDDSSSAFSFARERDWQVAVKPIGLTDGLGVRVFGDQLHDENDARLYVEKILSEKGDDKNKVIVEERIFGEEFTLQCLVNGDLLIPTPAVQDFKKKMVGDKGPNTASMGSYSDAGFLLPIMDYSDYENALGIIQATIEGLKSETGESCRGFLYGQFMLTGKGLRLVEYNFRPGDPEWMNTLTVFNDDLLDIIESLFNGREKSCLFEEKATVCKYIIPRQYPEKLNCILPVSIDEAALSNTGARMYYSCGRDDAGRLRVGTERGIAFVAADNTISGAYQKVEKAIECVKGDFYYRSDIGTADQIARKCEIVENMKGHGC